MCFFIEHYTLTGLSDHCFSVTEHLLFLSFYLRTFLSFLLFLTSAWLPGARVLLHLSQRRQGRCQSFPSDVTFSAIVTYTRTVYTHTCETPWQPLCKFTPFFFTSPCFLDVWKYSPKYTFLLHRGHRLASPEKVVMLPAADTLRTHYNTGNWKT